MPGAITPQRGRESKDKPPFCLLLPEHLVLMAFGVMGVLIGGAVAGKIVDRLNVATMRKLIYVMIGIGGVINLLG